MDWKTLFVPIVIALVPIIVALLKRFIPPSQAWLYPLLATGLGALLDTVSQYATGTSLGPRWGAVLGLAGVGLREVVDQLRNIRTGPGLRVLILLLVPLLLIGCASGTKALIVSGESLDATGKQFVQVAALYSDLLDKGMVTAEQYRRWRIFGQHFQFAYPKAVQLWRDARAANDVAAEKRAAALVQSLATDLAVFAAQSYEYLKRPPKPAPGPSAWASALAA